MQNEFNETISPLSGRFQALHEAASSFNNGAYDLQHTLSVTDETSRVLFGALTRITAYADQLDMILSLVREDVRVVEELTSEPFAAMWKNRFGSSLYEWLCIARGANAKVN